MSFILMLPSCSSSSFQKKPDDEVDEEKMSMRERHLTPMG